MLHYLIQVTRVLMPAFAGWVLCRAIGWIPACGIGLACAAFLPATGAMLLRSSKDGEISWRNRVAGWLIPWGYRVGRGKLVPIGIISAVVWICLWGFGIILADQRDANLESQQTWGGPFVINCLLLASWLTVGGVLFYFMGQLAQQGSFRRPPGSTLAKAIAVAGVLIGVSVVLKLSGLAVAALLIAGLPLLTVGLAAGAWCGLMIVVGKNARWN